MSHILEHHYAHYYWLTVDLPDAQFNNFIENINKVELIDGVDEESKSVCIKFDQIKPHKQYDIKYAKEMNKKNCRKFLECLSKRIDGRLYFNINHNIIKLKNG